MALRRYMAKATKPISTTIQVPRGSGTTAAAGDAYMIAKSASDKVFPVLGKMVELKLESIDCVPPEFKVTKSGLRVPVNVAIVGNGFVPPIAIEFPLNDSPSAERVK